MARKIGAIIALDGEQQFKSAVSACTKSLNTMKSALSLVEAQMSGQEKSLEGLRKKQSALNDVLEASRKREEEVAAGLSHAQSDYEKVGKQVEVYQRALEKAQKHLAEMKASGEATDDELKEQQKLVGDLATVVERGSKAYETAGNRVQDWEKRLNDAKTETVKAEHAVDDINDEIKEMEKATDRTADELDDYSDEAKEAAKRTGELEISLKSMVKNTAVNLAVDAMREIGEKAVEAAKYVVKVGSDFEAAMDKVAAISGATGSEFDALTEKAREMGSTTRFSATESAEAFEYMAMAGWKTEDMLDGIEGIMDLAAASGEDLATTSDIVTDALTAFGLSAQDSGHFADILATASANANTNVSILGESFKYAAPVVGALGSSAEDASIALGLMANAGIKSSQAGTALRTGLTNLAKPTKQMKEWMDKYNVSLVENADGSINLRATMEDLRQKMGGLSEAEQAAAASAIFGKNSMAGWLAIINASDSDFDKLASAIDNCDGSAKGMAETMEGNLAGAVTEFQSALEGLGIAVYDKVAKPLTAGVQFATGVLSGLTDALKEHKSENDIIIEQIRTANEALNSSIGNAGQIQADAAAKAGQIDVLTEALQSLNAQDKLDETQKKRLKEVYDELVQLVPSLAGHYDEETGKVNLTAEAVRDLTEARKQEIVEQGKLKAFTAIYEELGKAQGELQLAMANVKGMENQSAMWISLQKLVGKATDKYRELANTFQGERIDNEWAVQFQEDWTKIAQEALNSGAITTTQYKEIEELFTQPMSESTLIQLYDILGEKIVETDKDIADATEKIGELEDGMADAEQTVKNLAGSMEEGGSKTADLVRATEEAATSVTTAIEAEKLLKKYTDEATDSVEKSTEALEGESTATEGLADALKPLVEGFADFSNQVGEAVKEGYTQMIEESVQAAKDEAESLRNLRSAANEARDDMTKAFDDIKKSAESTFSDNPFEMWNQDASKGMLAFEEALKSQIDGLLRYKDNLSTVRDHLGETAPEFVQYLEDMGEGGAQLVAEFADAFRNGDTTAVDRLMDYYKQRVDIQEDLTNTIALDKLALQTGLASLSPEAIDAWNEMGYAFDAGVAVVRAKGGEITQATSDAFWQAVEASKAGGLEVPKGAAEAIRNSDDPEKAIQEQIGLMNARIQASANTLLDIAKKSGVNIPIGVAESIKTGKNVPEAYQTLLGIIKKEVPNFEAAGEEAGEAAGEATAEGIENKQSAIENAATGAVASAKSAGIAEAQNFDDVGETGMDSMQSGINDEASVVADGVIDAITGAATSGESHADTRLFALGRYVIAKMITGIESRYGNAYDAGYDAVLNVSNGMNAASLVAESQASVIANSVVGKFSVSTDAWYAGYNASIGFGNGIMAGAWYASYCAQSLAYQAINAMRTTLAVASPSKKFYEIGDYAVKGFTNALEDGESAVESAVAKTFGIDPFVADSLTDFSGTVSLNTGSGSAERLDALLDVVGQYLPEILEASQSQKEITVDGDFMGTLAQRTSETIGRNARRV